MNKDIQKKITPILRKYGIRHAALFGSTSRGNATQKSDVDLLVSLGKPMGAFTYARMVGELKVAVGRDVDVITDKSINPFLKPYIEKDLRPIYER